MFGLKKKNTMVSTKKDAANASKKSGLGSASQAGTSISAWSMQPALLATILIAALALALELFFVRTIEDGHQRNINQSYAALVQRDIDLMATERLEAVKYIANDPMVVERLRQTHASSFDLLKASLPDLVDYYIVPQTQLSQIRAIYPKLGYASVDAIRKARNVDTAKLEAFFDGNAWFYQVAVTVSGEVPATLLFLFDTNKISKALQKQAQILQGSVSIYSGSNANATKVMAFGLASSQASLNLPLTLGSWELRYVPTHAGLIAVDRTMLWLSIGLAAVLSLILIYGLCRMRLGRVRADVVLASTLIQSSLKGDHKKTSRLRYSETIDLVELANKAVKEQALTAKSKTSTVKVESVVNESLPLTQMEVEEAASEIVTDDDLNFDDLDLDEELGLGDNESVMEAETLDEVSATGFEIDPSIFRAYDIRGIVDQDLTIPGVEMIGKALASEALAQGQTRLCVGYDGRLSSEDYCEAICRGITSTGADAIVVGRVPTPVLYFATHQLETGTGVMITGSHNPSNYNGFKMMVAGNTLSGDAIQSLYQRIATGDMASGQGQVTTQEVEESYLDTIINDVAVAAPLKVVLDAGNGVAGELAPKLVEELGCDVIPLFCEIDGTFPNHHPDPGKPKNLQDLIAAVEEHDADIGLAFDGDGDRVGVVTNTGKIIWPDRLLMLFAKDVVSRNPGADVIYDVKCSRRLNGLISSYGGRPIMWKTGHSLIKAKMKETGALLAGEMSGHVFFKERWFGFDDGLYSAVRLLEILGVEDRTADEVFADFPEDVSTPEINITVSDETKFDLVERLCARAPAFEDGNVSTIDGLRVDFADGWGLCRASNTTPVLVLRFEADTEVALKRIQTRFKEQLLAVDSSLQIEF